MAPSWLCHLLFALQNLPLPQASTLTHHSPWGIQCIIHKNRWRCGFEDLRKQRTYERCSTWEKERRYQHNQWFLCPTDAGEVTQFYKMDRPCGHCARCADKHRRRNEQPEQRMKTDIQQLAMTFIDWESSAGPNCGAYMMAAAEALAGYVNAVHEGARAVAKTVELDHWALAAYERAFYLLTGSGGGTGILHRGSFTPSTPQTSSVAGVHGQAGHVKEPSDRKRVRELWGQDMEEDGRMGEGKRQCTQSRYQQDRW